ncbi:MAG TPA: pyridoxamine 5'-phosphate oxidase family protein [Paenibacillus sp.]|uniref:pyridoxamine 5'-phosphate oxidase family protein n=1 Tax=Paenibacillus sp. TaxID=58172 RepID=UPI0028CFDE99|nr:pyridoxamine 5'-phosphate oxidase family protein [Paenibacillus sp.]HUC93156.1 pyridoxamine 5'-phosphate oxidase family protein [Paenibacillus sp.]
MTEPNTALSEALFNQLQSESFVLLHTIDAESGSPTSNAISWVYAVDPGRIRFAVDGRSRLVANLAANPAVCATLFGSGTVHAVYGRAAIVAESLEGVPFKLVCFDIAVSAVRDAMFYGARVTVAPEYEKTYDKRAADKLDGQVFAAMKKA